MRKVSQEEFESLRREIIDGKKSKASVIRDLQTESRTFNNKIQEMSITNPDLYREFIKVHPYKPRERKDINIVGLLIELLKTGSTLEEICDKYHIGIRTVSRKISQLKNSEKESEKELYGLYKAVARRKSNVKQLTASERYRIENLEAQEVKGIDDTERRKRELLDLEKQYQALCLECGKEEAAKRLGYTPNRIYKLLNELYRIEIEENEVRRVADTKEDFRNSMKVDTTKLENNEESITERNVGITKNKERNIQEER